MKDDFFIEQIVDQIRKNVQAEIDSHQAAAEEIKQRLDAYMERVNMALLAYEGEIKETVRRRTIARLKGEPDPKSTVEDMALAVAEAVENADLRNAVDRLPEFRKSKRAEVAPVDVMPSITVAPKAEVSAPVLPKAQQTGQPSFAEEKEALPLVTESHPREQEPEVDSASKKTDAESTEKAPLSPGEFPNLAAHSEEKPLLLSGGVQEPKKIEWLKAKLGIHAEWSSPTRGSKADSWLKPLHNGSLCGVIFFVGYSSHEHYKSVKAACAKSGTPMVDCHGAGQGQMREAMKKLDNLLLKAELAKYESSNGEKK